MKMHHPNTNWFLAQLKPNCSKIAVTNLNRQGFQTFLPLIEETRQIKGKFINSIRPLLPGYIFVALDVTSGPWRAVNSTYGISQLVCFGKKPTKVPLDLISQLMLRCDVNFKMLRHEFLKPLDHVRLTKGPFANYVAEVEKITPDRRVWVLMEIMGCQTRVAVTSDQIQPI